MRVTRLQLHNYRNYTRADIAPCPGITVFHGDNAQGKTALLEAVYLCCIGRAHRTKHDKELIRWGEQQARVQLDVLRQDGSHEIDILLSSTARKRVKVNAAQLSRSGELMGHVNGVLFSPEDLALVKDGPGARRRFIDMELSQIRPSYYYALQRYHRALTQRGALLREAGIKPALLSSIDDWDEQLAIAGAEIIAQRRLFLGKLDQVAGAIHRDISGGREQLKLHYEQSLRSDETDNGLVEAFRMALLAAREVDLRRQTTTIGPHRDDLGIVLNGVDARAYGSQGQQRTCALSLKLSELHVMHEVSGEWPVLMLDDVMSELDPSRRRQLFSMLRDVQTLVTCTDTSDLGGARVGMMVHVHDGVATTEE
ncbi:DNA replication/repair protein RecF [Eubacteriales bacterium OttesenSCG-928-N13]|nr:DNA replication/repair protein RecF [Eubacteriales bacterium OttesenSCG-928-N13]